MSTEVAVILNPRAGGGKAQELWKKLVPDLHFLKSYEVVLTTGRHDATRLVREALKNGISKILVVGGDGVLSEGLNGFFEGNDLIQPKAWLGTIPLGSGCDFAKTWGVYSTTQALQRLKRFETQPIDIGKVEFANREGELRQRYFINIASFGCSAVVAKRVNHSQKKLGSKLTYFLNTLQTFLSYPAQEVRIMVPGAPEMTRTLMCGFVCNGRFSGSGMQWAPRADLTDGKFDVTLIRAMSTLGGLINLPKIYSGKLTQVSQVETFTCDGVSLQGKAPLDLELDGEDMTVQKASFKLLPQKINFWF
ncbi:MAG: diacylglycerol kinase family lipid kinase [Deltaproteobacteria bacterium]|nr:diacylglycerol kinase family lipid kinase [Deltaproteobacteria bacterium]